MTVITNRFDPWGPISTVLYETNDSDFVLNAVSNTGIDIEWHPLTKDETYSNSTRIRAFRQDISKAYQNLNQDGKGQFAQIIVKAILGRPNSATLCSKISDLLRDIGWTLSESGILKTDDALVSEQFFPPNSEYDAYITIREILSNATAKILIVDTYVSSSLLSILKGLAAQNINVLVLTVESNLKNDFLYEVTTFKKQFQHFKIEVRTTAEFHDRFIVIDDYKFYHVGASIKDAGKRAFMVSRIEDRPNMDNLKKAIDRAWRSGKILQ